MAITIKIKKTENNITIILFLLHSMRSFLLNDSGIDNSPFGSLKPPELPPPPPVVASSPQY